MSAATPQTAGLWAGVIAPILFTAIYLVEGMTRPGYDPMRHQVSLLSLGPGGGVQIASFIATGSLLLAFAAALRGELVPGMSATSIPAAVATSGVGFILAGIFTTQPLFGYPPGTPQGMATEITMGSVGHLLGALLLFAGLVVAAAAHGRRSWRAGEKCWALASVGAAVTVFACFGASGGGPSGHLLLPDVAGLLQRISLTAGLGWVLAIALGMPLR